MLARIRVLGLDHEGERADGLQVGGLELVEGDFELLGARPLAPVDLGDVAGEDEELALQGVGVGSQGGELDGQRVVLGPMPAPALEPLPGAHGACSTSLRTWSRSSRDENGLPRKSSAPAVRLASSVSMSSRAESIRTRGRELSSCSSTVTPFMPGIITSR